MTTPPEVRESPPHPPPQRQFVVVLEGALEVETTDGQKRTFAPAMIVLVEDVVGQGHVTNVISPTLFIIMPVAIAD